jgi:hypothetical protein
MRSLRHERFGNRSVEMCLPSCFVCERIEDGKASAPEPKRSEVFVPPAGTTMRAWRMPGLYLLTVKPERMPAPMRRFE